VEEVRIFQDAAGHRVAGILSTPAEPTDRMVVLCHGFLSSKNSTTNKTLTRLLTDHGVATFRFDFFGQGESQGPFSDMTLTIALGQAMSALDLVASAGFRRLGVMGSSFGGLVAVLTAAKRKDLRAVALKCPVGDFPEVLRLEFGDAGMETWKLRREIPDVVTGGSQPIPLRYALYEDCLVYDAYKAAESIEAPVLIVQGDCDALVPLSQSRRLMDAIRTEKRLEILKGADHGFTKREDFHRMTTLISDWMARHL
jgi:pimeloyl-ACP methyl ester carboxylesterase